MSKYIYMAGLLDGEGTVGLGQSNKGRFRAPYISITSTTPEIMNWLVENFGGIICKQKVYQAHHKQSWSWRLRNKEQINSLLTGILPYMLEPEKIRRANMILHEYPVVTIRNGRYTPEQLALKLDFESRFLA